MRGARGRAARSTYAKGRLADTVVSITANSVPSEPDSATRLPCFYLLFRPAPPSCPLLGQIPSRCVPREFLRSETRGKVVPYSDLRRRRSQWPGGASPISEDRGCRTQSRPLIYNARRH